MITKIYCFFRDFNNKIKLKIVTRSIKKKVTLIGGHQAFFRSSRVYLFSGSTKKDVILEDHCDMFGIIRSYAGGKVIMHEWSKIGRSSTITAVNRVEIGANTAISFGVEIIDNNNHPVNPEDRLYMRHTPHGSLEREPQYSANAPIYIGKNVLVGSHSRIQKGVTIGDNAIIAANAVVTHDVPANSIAAGNPAKIVKTDIDKTTTPIFPLKD